jgi:23S rRNA (adenine2030-N6)-methyltransferase
MKYRHSFHAGNFADVHKHVTLLSLLRALQKKDKGFLYLDTHAGSGSYDLSTPTAEARGGVLRLLAAPPQAKEPQAEELQDYRQLLDELHALPGWRHLYPGSPLIAARVLRPQDRAVLLEIQGAEVHALGDALGRLPGEHAQRVRVERGDGFERLKAFLPPPERRGLTLIDPPYEDGRDDPAQVSASLQEALRRFPTGVHAAWYPIKQERQAATFVEQCAAQLAVPVLVSEIWLYPRDARLALNGSGLLIVNAPWQTLERMQVWLPQLQECLATGEAAGNTARLLGAPA